MLPASHLVRLDPEPADLLPELQTVLEAQGNPSITASRAAGVLRFESNTAEFMLQARVADALTATCPDWPQRLVREG